jgi:spore maturation protein SpmA
LFRLLGFYFRDFFENSLNIIFSIEDAQIFKTIITGIFDMSKFSVMEIALPLTGMMAFWLGIMKVGERGGIIEKLSVVIAPFFSKIFPSVPKGHPASGSMIMNFAANMLGLDNAATPLGLKAMKELQEINTEKDTASDAQIMFLVLNTSGLTLIPVSILVYRSQQHAANPSDVFIPILLATFFSTLAGLLAVSVYQKINLLNKTVLAFVGGLSLVVSGIIWYFSGLSSEKADFVSSVAGNFILFAIIILFFAVAVRKKINIYESFIDGAKEGFSVAVSIIPYLVAMLVAISAFRASGALDFIVGGIAAAVNSMNINADFVTALPTALMKPLSGSGARAMMIETMKTHGADSFAGRLACIFQGSTETTFYTLAVYFGAVSVRNTRYTLVCGLIADFAGIIAAILITYLFFG